jgi:hypothetical protein
VAPKIARFKPIAHIIQGITRMIMGPTELKMQLTIHLQSKPGYGRGKYLG